jgi:hypothetical protein
MEITIEMMKKFGFENVRGGLWATPGNKKARSIIQRINDCNTHRYIDNLFLLN